MAKKVKGFMTQDGQFYETKTEAEYEEAKAIVEGLLLGVGAPWHSPHVSTVIFMEQNYEEVERFIKAVQAKRGVAQERLVDDWEYQYGEDGSPSRVSKNDTDPPDDGGGEEGATPALEQSPKRGEYVSDLGRSVSAKEIRDQREKHGSRSRKPHARRVRRSKNLAVGTPPEPTKTR